MDTEYRDITEEHVRGTFKYKPLEELDFLKREDIRCLRFGIFATLFAIISFPTIYYLINNIN